MQKERMMKPSKQEKERSLEVNIEKMLIPRSTK